MQIVLAVIVGVSLAAACGFRVFVPLLVLSIAAHASAVNLGPSLAWLGSTPAIIAFGVASVVEVVAYKVPWLDHALDTIASPAAVIAGSIVAASQLGAISGIDPLLQWSAAIIAGGGAAAAVQATSVSTRAASTVTTAGFANPFISAFQSVMSLVTSVLAVLSPFVAALFFVVFFAALLWAANRFIRRPRLAIAPLPE